MDCFCCKTYFPDISLLTCKHSLCCDCYVKMKMNKNNNCLLCDKKLRRGRKRNRINNL